MIIRKKEKPLFLSLALAVNGDFKILVFGLVNFFA
jgi:hypothetical protein